jgi:type 2 lantibiotic biosynthesis protein LanM
VVYKPKDLGAEEAYFSILQWFNRHGAPLEFRAVRVLRRKGYGWAEFVDKRPCESVEQAHRYYRRAGHLLCVCYVLAGSDCHFDNLIASGEHPVLVDGEMLFQPAFAGRETTNNVLRTGLLPRPAAGTEDFSGLGCVADRGMPLRIPEWLGPNSDAMSLRFRPATIQPRSNVPFLGDTPLSPHDYVEDMVRGFQEMYACVLANRMHLLAPEGPLAAMAAQQVRVLLRGTPEYLLAMSAALHPQRLRRHGLPDVPLEAFPPARAALAPFGRFELSALQQMDVPRFLVPASSTGMFFRDDFENDGLEIPGCFSQSGLERVMVGIRGLDQADMARQTGLIRMAWSFASLSRMASE